MWKIVEGQTHPLLSWQKYGGGTGEPNAPYLIYTAEHLNALDAEPNDYDKHFELMADTDLSEYVYDRAVIAPDVSDLPNWWGRSDFDGNGHRISHLVIDGISSLGLFGSFGKEIFNLGLELANVSGTGGFIGGLVGWSHGRNFTRSYCTGTVAGGDVVGGLVGGNNATITMSYSAASVMGDNEVGGLIGYDEAEHACEVFWPYHCYSTGRVSGETAVGGVIGISGNRGGWPVSCFWDVETSLQDTSGGYEWSRGETLEEVGLTTAEMQTAATFLEAGWDFIDEAENGTEDIRWIDEGVDYPRLW